MRLSRTAWLVLAVGIFVIAFACLYTINSGQAKEQGQLNSSLATAQAQLPKLVSDRGALEGQLAQQQSALAEAQSLLDKAKAGFPKSSESIEYDEILFSLAHGCDLEIMSLSAAEPSEKKVEDVTYFVTSFTVEVRSKVANGDVSNILNFVHDLATSKDFTSTTVELVNIKVVATAVGEEPTPPTATINFVAYSYKGE